MHLLILLLGIQIEMIHYLVMHESWSGGKVSQDEGNGNHAESTIQVAIVAQQVSHDQSFLVSR